MAKTKLLCVCGSTEKPQCHHLFRKGIRKKWKKYGIKKIKVYWSKKDKQIETMIPINAYVKLCPVCHKLSHPENLNYHLNQLVVQCLK